MCVVVGKQRDAPVAYLCGILNSELIDLWYGVRGRVARDVWREYEPLPLRRVPYRRPDGDPRAEEVASLVRELGANRRALLPHRAVVHDLGRIVKDPWKDGPVVLDRTALVGSLAAGDRVSVRLDPGLTVSVAETPMGKPRRESAGLLVFRRGRTETGSVEGPSARLDLLVELVAGRTIDDVRQLELPKDEVALSERESAVSTEVSELLAEGRRLVERVERLVCDLYNVPAELADAVVAHAVARARAGMPDDGVASASD